MIKKGLNNFNILVSDISGSEVVGLSASDFVLSGQIASDIYETSVIIEVNPSVEDGIYIVNVDILNSGQGFLKFTTTDPNHLITPDYFDLNIVNHDTDDIFSRITINFLEISTSIDSSFKTSRLTAKEGDDTIFQIATGKVLTDFTDFKATIVLSNIEPPSGANLIGEMDIENVIEEDGVVTLKIPFDITDGIIPQGQTQIRLFSDLQARDSDGNRITLAEINITLRRQFTTG